MSTISPVRRAGPEPVRRAGPEVRRAGPTRPQPPPAPRRPPRATTPLRRPRVPAAAAVGAGMAFIAVAVAGFTRMWAQGSLVLDGPGVSMFVRLALDHWQGLGAPYWLSDMWAGSPAWSLAPSFPVLILVPLAAVVGPDAAVRLACVAAQIVGGWGAFVLARTLWRRWIPAVAAGFLYALHPLFLSHAFFGHETSLWVMAATPWLVWSLRLALRGAGARYVALAGLIVGFAVLQQAEHIYGLAILCAAVLLVELASARLTGGGPRGASGVLFRASVVVLIGLGTIAHWLVPFMASHANFVLTTPDNVRAVLVEGIAGDLGREMGLFVTRGSAVAGQVGFDHDLLTGNFYLGWVGLGLSLLILPFLGRYDEDGCLTAVLFASAVGVWMSTAAVPLAAGGPAERRQLLPFVVVGVLAGLLVGSFVRRLRLGRWAVFGAAATTVLLVALPYLTPFVALQRVIPFLAAIRFPRFYHVAALGTALGASYAVVLVQRWAEGRDGRLAPLLTAAAALVVMGAFLVDIYPYRSYYRVRPPARDLAYERAARQLDRNGTNDRLALPTYGDPSAVDHVLRLGRDMSSGWPHPIAGREMWRLTGEAFFGPSGYRDAAIGLTGASHLVEEVFIHPDVGGPSVDEVRLVPNPDVLPMVRAYDRAVVVGDRDLAPLLATSLARRNVGVVTGGAKVAEGLWGAAVAALPADNGCDAALGNLPEQVGGEVAGACSLNRWVGTFADTASEPAAARPGGLFEAPLDGLRGLSLWLDRPPGATVLTVWELSEDGRSLGEQVASVFASGYDQNGMVAFRFGPVADSGRKRYAFEITCPTCSGEDGFARLATAPAQRSEPNLLRERRTVPDRVADFTLLYDRMPVGEPSATRIEARRAGTGRWDLRTSGTAASVVVVTEAWFPGWKVTVDGKPAPVLQADGAFLGVAVQPGEHDVVFTYHIRPAVTLGRLITLGTLVLAGLLIVAPWWRRRRSAAGAAPPAPSVPPGDALDVGAPPRRPRRWKPVLQRAHRQPRPAAGERQRPGGERDEAVLAPVDDRQPGAGQQAQQRRRREPGANGHAIPLRMKSPGHPNGRVVLHRLGQDEVPPRTQDPPDLVQDPGGVVEVVEHMDAPHHPDRPVTEW